MDEKSQLLAKLQETIEENAFLKRKIEELKQKLNEALGGVGNTKEFLEKLPGGAGVDNKENSDDTKQEEGTEETVKKAKDLMGSFF